MAIEKRYKDSEEVISFGVDWADYLGSDTLESSDWIIPVGLTKTGQSISGKQTFVTLSGGVIGAIKRITNRITTSAGETVDQSIDIEIINK